MAGSAVAGFRCSGTGRSHGPARWCRLTLLIIVVLISGSASAGSPTGAMLASGCTGCHGTNGVSRGSALPSIAGIDRRYLMRVMLEFKYGTRPASIMGRIAQGYSDNELRRVSAFFSNLPWGNDGPMHAASQLTEGEGLHIQGCEECHERQGRHQDRDISRIAGQGEEYLFIQLTMYRTQQNGNLQPEKMRIALEGLTDQQMNALSWFYSQQR